MHSSVRLCIEKKYEGIMTEITVRIFELLKEKNLSQKEFSKQTGIAEASISDWKRKGTNPSAGKIMDICKCLEVSPEELLAGDSTQHDYVIAYSKEEQELIENFRQMKGRQKTRVLGYMTALMEKNV